MGVRPHCGSDRGRLVWREACRGTVRNLLRHPMYAGIFLFNVGMALWLESYAAAIFTLVPIGLLAVRIVFEERFLRRELAGYEEYTRRVRWRLVPLVW